MIGKSDHFVVIFDETLNEYLQKKQLDVHVRLCNNSEVTTRYVTSTFMGHSTADDLTQNFWRKHSHTFLLTLLEFGPFSSLKSLKSPWIFSQIFCTNPAALTPIKWQQTSSWCTCYLEPERQSLNCFPHAVWNSCWITYAWLLAAAKICAAGTACRVRRRRVPHSIETKPHNRNQEKLHALTSRKTRMRTQLSRQDALGRKVSHQ